MGESKIRIKLEDKTCALCGRKNGKRNKQITKHYVIPLAWGGKDDLSNIQFLCMGCHKGIHNPPPKKINPKALEEYPINLSFGRLQLQVNLQEADYIINQIEEQRRELDQ